MSGASPEYLDVALAIPVRERRVLVVRRAVGAHLGGLWEFPGGKLAAGEQAQAAARRELAEETGLVARALEPLSLFVHEYPERTIRFHVFLAPDAAGDPHLDAGAEWGWKTLDELRGLAMPPANAAMLGALGLRLER